MEGISLDFHCFKAINNNLEAQLFYTFIFMPHSDLPMACRTMQLRFFKLVTVLTYAFKLLPKHPTSIFGWDIVVVQDPLEEGQIQDFHLKPLFKHTVVDRFKKF